MWNFRRTRRRWLGLWVAVGATLAPLATWASAQDAEKPNPEAPREANPKAESAPKTVALKEPTDYRVYQRDRNNRAEIPVVFEGAEESKEFQILDASLRNEQGGVVGRFENEKFVDVPTGGPYKVKILWKTGKDVMTSPREGGGRIDVFVGDLWVLAGQSNMEGVADLVDVTTPNLEVGLLGMNGAWSKAEEPLHWLVDSPDPVHSGDPKTREKRSAEQHKQRTRGAGLGLPFAEAMVAAAHVPVGLIACAHGGTSMEQWSPAQKDQGGKSLYGSMLRQINRAGGKVKGVLWYQGESDANPKAAEAFPRAFADLIAAVRSDLDQPELPFYYAQIGRVVRAGDPKPWNAVQDAQRRIAEQTPNTAVISVIDLELDDGIHVGTQGQKRAGRRLAKIALRELFGQVGATTPTFDRVNKGARNTLVVKFKGVNIAPASANQPGTPFIRGMGGQGGQGMMTTPPANTEPGFRQMPTRGAAPIRPNESGVVGLRPARHIAGFSIRKEDGTEIPLIFDAAVGEARDTVILKLNGRLPEKQSLFLWYGYGFDPYCNLTDALDMAVPVFGPIPLDDLN